MRVNHARKTMLPETKLHLCLPPDAHKKRFAGVGVIQNFNDFQGFLTKYEHT